MKENEMNPLPDAENEAPVIVNQPHYSDKVLFLVRGQKLWLPLNRTETMRELAIRALRMMGFSAGDAELDALALKRWAMSLPNNRLVLDWEQTPEQVAEDFFTAPFVELNFIQQPS